jgi:hypothetical protein
MKARRFIDRLADGARVPFWIAGISIGLVGGAHLIGRLA